MEVILKPENFDHLRPVTRCDCENGVRPCPWVGCRYHLAVQITDAGSLVIANPEIPPWEMEHTCSLDVADTYGGLTMSSVGALMCLTRERIRQIENTAVEKMVQAFSWDPEYRRDDRYIQVKGLAMAPNQPIEHTFSRESQPKVSQTFSAISSATSKGLRGAKVEALFNELMSQWS